MRRRICPMIFIILLFLLWFFLLLFSLSLSVYRYDHLFVQLPASHTHLLVAKYSTRSPLDSSELCIIIYWRSKGVEVYWGLVLIWLIEKQQLQSATTTTAATTTTTIDILLNIVSLVIYIYIFMKYILLIMIVPLIIRSDKVVLFMPLLFFYIHNIFYTLLPAFCLVCIFCLPLKRHTTSVNGNDQRVGLIIGEVTGLSVFGWNGTKWRRLVGNTNYYCFATNTYLYSTDYTLRT